jgi:O-antigen ligase
MEGNNLMKVEQVAHNTKSSLYTLSCIGLLGWAIFAPISLIPSLIFIAFSFIITGAHFVIDKLSKRDLNHHQNILYHLKKRYSLPTIGIMIWFLSQVPSVFCSDKIWYSLLGLANSDFLLIMCLLIWWLNPSDKWILRWIFALVASSSVVSLYALWQHFSGHNLIEGDALTRMGVFFRSQGFFPHYLSFAAVQLGIWCIAVTVAFLSVLKRHRLYWVTSSILIALSLWTTYGRMVWVTAGIIFVVVLISTKNKKIVFIWLGIITATIVLAITAVPEFGGRLMSVFYISQWGRVPLWKGALAMFLSHPLTGIGVGRFQDIFPKYYCGTGYVRNFCHAHSYLLNRLAETGIVGMAGAIIMWVILFWMGWRMWRTHDDKVRVIIGKSAAISLLALWIIEWGDCYYSDAEIGAVWWFMVGVLGVSSQP